jgi:hypothetical protein
MCLQLLLTMLKQRLPGLRIGWDSENVSVVAYADDVIVLLTSVADFSTVQQFERASIVRLDPRKSRAIPIGRCPPRHHWYLMPTPRKDTELSFLGNFMTDHLRLVDPTCRTGKITSKGLLSSRPVSRT